MECPECSALPFTLHKHTHTHTHTYTQALLLSLALVRANLSLAKVRRLAALTGAVLGALA